MEYKGTKMERTKFELMLEEKSRRIQKTFSRKTKEYADDYDVFHTLLDIAGFAKMLPEKALLVLTMKHLCALKKLCENLERGFKEGNMENYIDKTDDVVLYMALFEGLLRRWLPE